MHTQQGEARQGKARQGSIPILPGRVMPCRSEAVPPPANVAIDGGVRCAALRYGRSRTNTHYTHDTHDRLCVTRGSGPLKAICSSLHHNPRPPALSSPKGSRARVPAATDG